MIEPERRKTPEPHGVGVRPIIIGDGQTIGLAVVARKGHAQRVFITDKVLAAGESNEATAAELIENGFRNAHGVPPLKDCGFPRRSWERFGP